MDAATTLLFPSQYSRFTPRAAGRVSVWGVGGRADGTGFDVHKSVQGRFLSSALARRRDWQAGFVPISLAVS